MKDEGVKVNQEGTRFRHSFKIRNECNGNFALMNKIKLASKLISYGWRLSICEKSLPVGRYDSGVKKRDFFAMPHTGQLVVSFDYYTYPVSFLKLSQHNNDVGVMLHQHSPEIIYCFF